MLGSIQSRPERLLGSLAPDSNNSALCEIVLALIWFDGWKHPDGATMTFPAALRHSRVEVSWLIE